MTNLKSFDFFSNDEWHFFQKIECVIRFFFEWHIRRMTHSVFFSNDIFDEWHIRFSFRMTDSSNDTFDFFFRMCHSIFFRMTNDKHFVIQLFFELRMTSILSFDFFPNDEWHFFFVIRKALVLTINFTLKASRSNWMTITQPIWRNLLADQPV